MPNERKNRQNGASGGRRVDIDTANGEELMRLDGIGDVDAEGSVRFREENGEMERLEDPEQVEGFARRTVEALQGQVSVGGRNA